MAVSDWGLSKSTSGDLDVFRINGHIFADDVVILRCLDQLPKLWLAEVGTIGEGDETEEGEVDGFGDHMRFQIFNLFKHSFYFLKYLLIRENNISNILDRLISLILKS